VSIPARRTVLRSGLAAAALGAVGAVTGCTARPDPSPSSAASPVRRRLIGPHSPQVAAAEAARHATGTTLAGVAPQAGHIDLGGPVVATWSYGGQVPGPEIRVRKGQTLQALLVNGLPVETTVHWHGVAIRNDMDGVPGMTQVPVPANREYTYSFAVAEPGTYWYHPHVGVQLDRGLYGPLIVEDPSEPADYDHDWTVVLDDWIDGTGYTPDQVLAALRHGMGGMSMAAASGSPGTTPAPSPMSSAPPTPASASPWAATR
jgi:multicopper oxidase